MKNVQLIQYYPCEWGKWRWSTGFNKDLGVFFFVLFVPSFPLPSKLCCFSFMGIMGKDLELTHQWFWTWRYFTWWYWANKEGASPFQRLVYSIQNKQTSMPGRREPEHSAQGCSCWVEVPVATWAWGQFLTWFLSLQWRCNHAAGALSEKHKAGRPQELIFYHSRHWLFECCKSCQFYYNVLWYFPNAFFDSFVFIT